METFLASIKLLIIVLFLFIAVYTALEIFVPNFLDGVFDKINGYLDSIGVSGD